MANKTNKSLEKINIIDKLYKAARLKKKEIYRKIAKLLETRSRENISVNLSKLEKLNNIKNNSVVVIPGKVLGKGNLTKDIIIYAFAYSDSAKMKLGKKAKDLVDFCEDKIEYKNSVIIR